jgi:hypothetical protein
MAGIDWIWFPKSSKPHELARGIVAVFQGVESSIASDSHDLPSNGVLLKIAPGLTSLGFGVESGKKEHEKIVVPVLFGLKGEPEKSFNADAYWEEKGFVVEVEAGRAVVNNQFLKDLFEACMMNGVEYLCIAVRKRYARKNDFEEVVRFFEALYASDRLKLPLTGILVVGY